jgi:hypothetical protein
LLRGFRDHMNHLAAPKMQVNSVSYRDWRRTGDRIGRDSQMRADEGR